MTVNCLQVPPLQLHGTCRFQELDRTAASIYSFNGLRSICLLVQPPHHLPQTQTTHTEWKIYTA